MTSGDVRAHDQPVEGQDPDVFANGESGDQGGIGGNTTCVRILPRGGAPLRLTLYQPDLFNEPRARPVSPWIPSLIS